jgi:peptidoglycan/xylan/chitin deacetylase (PgdA/CDA1 family)
MWYLAAVPILSILLALTSGSPLVGVVSFILLSVWVGPGIFLVGVPFLSRPLVRVRTQKPFVAVTFDDGPHPRYTRQILALLKEHGARATFFVVAQNADRHPDIIAQIISAGHEIANHSTAHRHLLSLCGLRTQIDDIGTAQRIIEERSGTSPRFFRPPMGYKTPETFWAARRLGLVLVAWDVKAWDTVSSDPRRIARRVLSHARPGSIVLLHDAPTLSKRLTDRSATVKALPLILAGLRTRGLSCVTLSQLTKVNGDRI